MITNEIKKMPTKERIILMEEIWDTLRHEDEEEIESPSWHQGVLEERRKRISDGNAAYMTIDQLKAKP